MEETITIAFVGHAAADHERAASSDEDAALPLLADHGAALVYRGRRSGGQDPALPYEVHLTRFPGRAADDGYLDDVRRQHPHDQHGEVFISTVVVELDTIVGVAE